MFYDSVPISKVRITDDGYLVGEARVARTGIQHYLGIEVGRPDIPIVRVYRPEEEVFAADSLRSYAHRPVTLEHPDQMVDSTNWKEHATGQTGDEVVRDGDTVRVPLVLMDKKAIDAHRAGVREMSMGYECDIVFDAGTTPEGEEYDAVQRNLRMNHLALVARARGGDRLRLGDEPNGELPMDNGNKPLRTVQIDGLPVETTDAGAQAIATLQSRLDDALTVNKDLEKEHKAALAAKDTELAEKDAEIGKLKDAQLTPEAIDQMVADRAELTAVATAIADGLDCKGKTDDEIRKAAVVAALGDKAVEGKSAEYIRARFDILAEEVVAGGKRQNPVHDALRTRPNDRQNIDDNGQADYEARLSNAWKGETHVNGSGRE